MQVVVMAMVVVKVVNLHENPVKNLHDVIVINLVILGTMLSVKNLKKVNRVARSQIKLQNVVNLKNLKVNVNDRGEYGKEI